MPDSVVFPEELLLIKTRKTAKWRRNMCQEFSEAECLKLEKSEGTQGENRQLNLLDLHCEDQREVKDFHAEAVKITDFIREDKASEAAHQLEKDLLPMTSGQRQAFLKELNDVNIKNSQDRPSTAGSLEMEDYNPKTGNFGRVEIKSNALADIYHDFRIVQPGDTMTKYALEHNGSERPDLWITYVADMNHIKNPDKIMVGQAIRVGAWYD
jgi:hypothetical protein